VALYSGQADSNLGSIAASLTAAGTDGSLAASAFGVLQPGVPLLALTVDSVAVQDAPRLDEANGQSTPVATKDLGDSNALSATAIAGVAIAAVVLLVLVVTMLVLRHRRRDQAAATTARTDSSTDPESSIVGEALPLKGATINPLSALGAQGVANPVNASAARLSRIHHLKGAAAAQRC
jgi:flagellar biosynthesis/type III secretory pathway M-ring protein FliF/YscJ